MKLAEVTGRYQNYEAINRPRKGAAQLKPLLPLLTRRPELGA